MNQTAIRQDIRDRFAAIRARAEARSISSFRSRPVSSDVLDNIDFPEFEVIDIVAIPEEILAPMAEVIA